jgi:hypothetical protein
MGPVRAGLVGSALLLLLVLGAYWISHRLSHLGQLEARFSEAIWATPIRDWQEGPVDVSDRVCPLVDDKLRVEIEAEEHWLLWVGNCVFPHLGEERTLAIEFNEAGQCVATVHLAASCSL